MTRIIVALLLAATVTAAERTEAPKSWHVEGDPQAVTQDVRFANGDAQLVGTVYLPEHGDHLPGVVALHGASEPTREAAVYRHLLESLPAMGFAVLIYDRRGSGASSGNLNGIDYQTLADDAIAARTALAKVPRIGERRALLLARNSASRSTKICSSRSCPNASPIGSACLPTNGTTHPHYQDRAPEQGSASGRKSNS